MQRLTGRLSPALRRWRGPLAIWALAAAAGTLAGPFGTFAALELPQRALYWGAVAALAVGLSVALHALHRGPLGGTRAAGLVLDLGYALAVGGAVHLLNRQLFDGWGGWGDFLWLVGLILAMAVALDLLRWLLKPPAPPPPPQADPVARFQQRLPPAARGPLIRIEAQDHYLLVVTRRGRAMLLMRMADAEAALGDTGLRVHRSHWVAHDGVRGLCRTGGRWRLHTADGAEVPVSRGQRPAVAAAGFTPAG